MRKLVTLIVISLITVTITACAFMGNKEETRVKCPACGYEFVAPHGGN
jgi:ribosomal protein S27E